MSLQILELLAGEGFEEVLALYDPRSKLRAFLALHDTRRGPAFGGIRRWSYLDEGAALRDCLRLSRSMTYKCAMAELEAGGGKLVVLDRPDLAPEEAYRYIGQLVERLAGRFYTGPDVGTGADELRWVAEHTSFVTDPGPLGPGLLAEATCEGVLAGMSAALRELDGEEDWERRTVVVQGLGEVGARVAGKLRDRGARVLAAETDPERAETMSRALEIELIDPASELDPPCDVFAPCALGGILHDLSLKRLRCRVIAGAANNVLASPEHGERVHELGILYVPDFVINSGALIRGARFHLHGVREPLDEIGGKIGAQATKILRMAADEELAPARVAVREAERRLDRDNAQWNARREERGGARE